MARNPRRHEPAELPPLYAMVHAGIEPVAADEINRDLGGEVKKTTRNFVVFRLDNITPDVLKLRTTEDVFLLAWGSDSLTFRADDLRTIQNWTARKPNWEQLFRIHHSLRPKTKGKPTYRLVCQLQGEHGYRRTDARDALRAGLAGKIPNGWLPADENAWLEIWLTVHGKTAVCGLRLSDRTMRHRTYKLEHVAASLRPTMAAAMVRLAGIGPGMTVLDPMCGAGTLLAETIELSKKRKYGTVHVLGGDLDPHAIFTTSENLVRVGPTDIARWDVHRLPLDELSVDRIVCNPPFGVQLAKPEEIPDLYDTLSRECDRVLRPGGRAVFIAAEQDVLRGALQGRGWSPTRQLRVRILGLPATISVWQKPEA